MRTANIESIDDEGRGLAILEGWIYVIRGAFPGDDVEIEIERVFKAHRLSVCRVKTYFKQGSCHSKRICPHELPCPACPLHGIQDSVIYEIKRNRILAALREQNLDFQVESVVPHPHILGYRHKVKLMVGGIPGDLRFGVYIPYSHRFSEASQCPHVCPEINQAIQKLLPILNQLHIATLKTVILRASDLGVAGVLVTSQHLPKALFERSPLLSLTERIQQEATNSLLEGDLGQSVGNLKALHADAFCQTDPVQAESMYQQVAEWIYEGPGNYIDAYAGEGGFSKALLAQGPCQISAMESNPVCKETLESLGISVFLGPCEKLNLKSGDYKGVILDPPQKGLLHEAKKWAALKAGRVVLVSCDPKSMARDLKVFVESGYQVHKIVPIDFFGATPAIETVVFLKDKSFASEDL